MPLISIVVPIYKVENYLRRCVDSILAQSFTDYELILVDDGSPDNCGAICDEYAMKNEKIHAFHSTNMGVSHARNLGLCNASGDFVCFVDGDDWIEPTFLERSVSIAEATHAEIVFFGHERITESGSRSFFIIKDRIVSKALAISNSQLISLLQNSYFSSCWGILFSRSAIAGHHFEENMVFGEDLLFVFDALRSNPIICAEPVAMYMYCSSDSSQVSSINNTKLWSAVKTYELLFDLKSRGFEVDEAFESFLIDRWINDFSFFNDRILHSKTPIKYKIKLYKALLNNKMLNAKILSSKNKYLVSVVRNYRIHVLLYAMKGHILI